MHIQQRICCVKSRDKEMFLYILCCVRALTLQLTHTHTERCVIIQVSLQSASEASRIVITYQLCVKTNSCVYNCKPDNKNKNPENL